MFRNSICLLLLFLFSCSNLDMGSETKTSDSTPLPFMGQYKLIDNGDGTTDTLLHKIGRFSFLNQDSAIITNADVHGKIHVADFFFTSCPTICPVMKTQMLRVYDSTRHDPEVMILSYTIDPEYDSVAVLREFAEQLGVSGDKWHFLTGEKEAIYKLGQSSYMVTAMEDSAEPGGYIHSGAFILVDGEGHVRGVYDGTDPVEVNDLISDIKRLKKENED